MRIEIAIDEIVLSGADVSQVDVFEVALRERLGELAAGNSRTVSWQGVDVPVVRAPGVRADGAESAGAGGPAALGTGVAESIWQSVVGQGGAP